MEMFGHKLVRVKTDKALQDGIQEDVQVFVGRCAEGANTVWGVAKATATGVRKGLSKSFNSNSARIDELEAIIKELQSK